MSASETWSTPRAWRSAPRGRGAASAPRTQSVTIRSRRLHLGACRRCPIDRIVQHHGSDPTRRSAGSSPGCRTSGAANRARNNLRSNVRGNAGSVSSRRRAWRATSSARESRCRCPHRRVLGGNDEGKAWNDFGGAGVGGRPGGRDESVGIGGQQVDAEARRREGEGGAGAVPQAADDSARTPRPLPAPAPTRQDGRVPGVRQSQLHTELPTAIEKAATALGWTFKAIPFKLADTSTFISAMDSALEFKPAFVMFTGVPEAAWAGEIPKYKAAGVGIVPTVSGTFKPDATILGYGNDTDYTDAAHRRCSGTGSSRIPVAQAMRLVMQLRRGPAGCRGSRMTFKKFVESELQQVQGRPSSTSANQQLASQASGGGDRVGGAGEPQHHACHHVGCRVP